MGIPADHILISEIGKVVELTPNSMKVVGTVPAGRVLVDGLGVGDVGSIVLRDRKPVSYTHLDVYKRQAQKGFVNEALVVDASATVTVDGQETGDGISYSLVDAPKGATIDQNGRLVFVPTELKNYEITVRAAYRDKESYLTIPVQVAGALLAPNESVAVNEIFHVTVVVPYQVSWVGIQNENGALMGLSNMSVSQKGMWKTRCV